PVPLLICKASSAHGCSPLTTLNQNFMQKGILECRQALEYFSVKWKKRMPLKCRKNKEIEFLSDCCAGSRRAKKPNG
ncbi:hypothetical protein, partial [Brucella ovis]